MPFQPFVHDAVWKELPEALHGKAKAIMKDVAAQSHPKNHGDVKALVDCKYPNSYRVRVERFRIIFITFPDEGKMVFTTAFMEKRKEDYRQAIERHEQRVRKWE